MENDEVEEIFIEVKTGTSASLTKRERQIRNAVQNKRVSWLELRLKRD
jgi:predicted Holliday junction resolvase-like endonuclease